MYSKEQKDIALRIYHQTESVTETIRILGYPTRRNLYTWIAEENTPPKTRKEYPVINNPPDHPRNKRCLCRFLLCFIHIRRNDQLAIFTFHLHIIPKMKAYFFQPFSLQCNCRNCFIFITALSTNLHASHVFLCHRNVPFQI